MRHTTLCAKRRAPLKLCRRALPGEGSDPAEDWAQKGVTWQAMEALGVLAESLGRCEPWIFLSSRFFRKGAP